MQKYYAFMADNWKRGNGNGNGNENGKGCLKRKNIVGVVNGARRRSVFVYANGEIILTKRSLIESMQCNGKRNKKVQPRKVKKNYENKSLKIISKKKKKP